MCAWRRGVEAVGAGKRAFDRRLALQGRLLGQRAELWAFGEDTIRAARASAHSGAGASAKATAGSADQAAQPVLREGPDTPKGSQRSFEQFSREHRPKGKASTEEEQRLENRHSLRLTTKIEGMGKELERIDHQMIEEQQTVNDETLKEMLEENSYGDTDEDLEFFRATLGNREEFRTDFRSRRDQKIEDRGFLKNLNSQREELIAELSRCKEEFHQSFEREFDGGYQNPNWTWGADSEFREGTSGSEKAGPYTTFGKQIKKGYSEFVYYTAANLAMALWGAYSKEKPEDSVQTLQNLADLGNINGHKRAVNDLIRFNEETLAAVQEPLQRLKDELLIYEDASPRDKAIMDQKISESSNGEFSYEKLQRRLEDFTGVERKTEERLAILTKTLISLDQYTPEQWGELNDDFQNWKEDCRLAQEQGAEIPELPDTLNEWAAHMRNLQESKQDLIQHIANRISTNAKKNSYLRSHPKVNLFLQEIIPSTLAAAALSFIPSTEAGKYISLIVKNPEIMEKILRASKFVGTDKMKVYLIAAILKVAGHMATGKNPSPKSAARIAEEFCQECNTDPDAILSLEALEYQARKTGVTTLTFLAGHTASSMLKMALTSLNVVDKLIPSLNAESTESVAKGVSDFVGDAVVDETVGEYIKGYPTTSGETVLQETEGQSYELTLKEGETPDITKMLEKIETLLLAAEQSHVSTQDLSYVERTKDYTRDTAYTIHDLFWHYLSSSSTPQETK